MFQYFITSYFQVTVQSYDLGNPRKYSQQVDVAISIGHNRNSPQFVQGSNYAVSLDENRNVGDLVLGLKAQDQDSNVSCFFCLFV